MIRARIIRILLLLASSSFNKEECLEGRPRLTAWMETMAPKAEPWFKERAEKHQGGHYNIIEAFGALRSPF